MQSGNIPNSHITASSMWDKNHPPWRGRLGITRVGSLIGSWSAKYNDNNQWIQVFLGRVTKVTAVATQGRQDYDQWVTSYSLQYSADGGAFIDYAAGRHFEGNYDQNSVIRHALAPPMTASYVRLLPKTWYKHISLRLELYGCSREGMFESCKNEK